MEAREPRRPRERNARRKVGRERAAKPARSSKWSESDVAGFLGALDHPLKREIAAVRKILLGVDSSIREGIKWNSLSYRTDEYFATVFLRSTETLQLVFHRGAKARDGTGPGTRLADPDGLVKWVAKDRCVVTLGAGKDVAAHRKAFEAIVRAWIREA